MNDRLFSTAVAAAFGLAALACVAQDPPASKRDAAAQWSAEGLQRVEIKGIKVAYARAGASLARYDKVLIAPIRVELSREYDRSLRNPLHLSAADEARIKADLAALVRDELAKELAAGGYAVVDRPTPGALAIDATVADVRENAPDIHIPDRVDVYARSAGEMTLVASLSDATSGTPLLRLYDPSRPFAYETTFPHHVTRVETDVEFRAAARDWARALRGELDRAKGAAR